MFRTAAALFLLSALGFSQTPGSPAFDVASIRPSQPGRESIEHGPDSLTMRNVRLIACMRYAYDVQDYQINGPAWINDTSFDVMAKADKPATEAELRRMLQTLLTERFHMTIHRDKKEMTALILTVSKKGHKLTPVETEGSPSFQTGKMNLTGKGATLKQLTDFLSRELRSPIIDETGLTGRFNYFLDINAYVTEEMQKSSGPPVEAPSILASAMQAQLGLKVDPRKAPVEVIVIDHLEKTPVEN